MRLPRDRVQADLFRTHFLLRFPTLRRHWFERLDPDGDTLCTCGEGCVCGPIADEYPIYDVIDLVLYPLTTQSGVMEPSTAMATR